MADLSITAANVVFGADAVIEHGVAGVAITAGQVVYIASSTGKYGLADSNSATAEVRVVRGIALHSAAANQPLAIQRAGSITIGATVVQGTAYALSETPGGIQPSADLGSGEYTTILGIATSASVILLNISPSGVAV